VETKCVGMGDPYCEFKAVPVETLTANGRLFRNENQVTRNNSSH
jgi:hypothetical protein